MNPSAASTTAWCYVIFVAAYILHTHTVTAVPATRHRVSVSGQSAGGSMAIQHLFAFSASVDGAAIAAGSPYGCGSLKHKTNRCAYGKQGGWKKINVPQLNHYARWRQSQGLIDDLSNLRNTPIVLFNGKDDWEVYINVMRATAIQLHAFVNETRVEKVFDTRAAHVWSIDHGNCYCGECGTKAPHRKNQKVLCCDVNNCHYDLSGDMLRRIYASIKPRQPAKSRLHFVEQDRYVPRNTTHRAALMRYGLAYVPTDCEAKPSRCRIHINYHGCMYRTWWRRREWSNTIDLNEYGEANDIVILYPQASGDKRTGVGCWNWGGFGDDPDFDTRKSLQLGMVANLVADLDNALSKHSIVVNNTDPPPPSALVDEDVEDGIGGDMRVARPTPYLSFNE